RRRHPARSGVRAGPAPRQRDCRQRARRGAGRGPAAGDACGGRRMIVAAFKDYLPLSDLLDIFLVCLTVAVIAPSAVAVAIVGLDRRNAAMERHESTFSGTAIIAAGVAVVVVLIATGLYALADK